MIPDADYLAYLHDAVLQSLNLAIDENGVQRISMVVICNPHAGYPAWDGKLLHLSAHEILVSRIATYGFSHGPDVIDSCTQELTDTMISDVSGLGQLGAQKAEAPLFIQLNSGTTIELVCKSISLEVIERNA